MELAKDPAWIVRWSVAGNTNTPSDVLDGLADDEHPSVRARARGCIAAPLHRLARQDWLRRPRAQGWRRGAIFPEEQPPRSVRQRVEATALPGPAVAVPAAQRPPVEPLSRSAKLRGITYFVGWFGLPGWVCIALSLLIPFVEVTAARYLLKGLLAAAMVLAAGIAWALASSRGVAATRGRLAIDVLAVTSILTKAGILLGIWTLIN